MEGMIKAPGGKLDTSAGQTSCLSMSWKVTEDVFHMKQTQILLYGDLRRYFYEMDTLYIW